MAGGGGVGVGVDRAKSRLENPCLLRRDTVTLHPA